MNELLADKMDSEKSEAIRCNACGGVGGTYTDDDSMGIPGYHFDRCEICKGRGWLIPNEEAPDGHKS